MFKNSCCFTQASVKLIDYHITYAQIITANEGSNPLLASLSVSNFNVLYQRSIVSSML